MPGDGSPCTIADIKAYRPEEKSVGAGQVLQSAYDFQKTRNVVREMADALALELVEKRLVTDQVVLTVGYDRENLTDPDGGRHTAGRSHGPVWPPDPQSRPGNGASAPPHVLLGPDRGGIYEPV